MKNVEAKITLLLLLFFTSAVNISVMANSTGVKSGDWIKYNVSVSGGGQTVQGWTKITVISVSGTQVSGTLETGITGQQPTNTTFSLDILTGSGSGSGFIIPANLTVGQAIPGEAATVTSIENWYSRKAVYTTATSPVVGMTGRIYWDQVTGVLLEATGSLGDVSFSIVAAETNMWSGGFGFAGFDWWLWVIIIVVVVVAITAIVLILRRRKPPVAPLPPPAQPSLPLPPPPTSIT